MNDAAQIFLGVVLVLCVAGYFRRWTTALAYSLTAWFFLAYILSHT